MSANTATGTVEDYQITGKWGWFVALGIVLIALGVAAWLDVVSVTLATTGVVGAILLVGGIFQIIHALMTREWRGFIFGLVSGLLYAAGGLIIMREPVQGAVVLTLVLAALIIVSGIVRIVLALRHRGVRAWGLVLLSGVVSVIVGALLYANLPWSGLWVLGTLIAIELLVQGASWLYFGIALRLVRRTAVA
jgi:uncharacterized membrane protein HdeD (DUF308 family)